MPNLSPQAMGAMMSRRQPRSRLDDDEVQTGKAHPRYNFPDTTPQTSANIGAVGESMAWRSHNLLPLNSRTLGTFYNF